MTFYIGHGDRGLDINLLLNNSFATAVRGFRYEVCSLRFAGLGREFVGGVAVCDVLTGYGWICTMVLRPGGGAGGFCFGAYGLYGQQ